MVYNVNPKVNKRTSIASEMLRCLKKIGVHIKFKTSWIAKNTSGVQKPPQSRQTKAAETAIMRYKIGHTIPNACRGGVSGDFLRES